MTDGRRQVVFAGLIAVVVTIAFFFLLLRPKMNQIAETRDQIEQARDRESVLLADLARLQSVREEAPRTRAQLARVADLLPATPELPSFIRLLQDASTREGIELTSIAPSPPSELDPDIQQIQVTVLIEGSFHRTEAFLARLENLERLVEVTSLSMAPTEDTLSGEVILNTTISLRMFVVEASA